jgi:hypothetical protein
VSSRVAWATGSLGTLVGTTDGGFSWQRFASGSFDAITCTPAGSCWASGAEERLGRLVFR